MFASALGIRLVLWMGKSVPLPATPELLAALVRAEATSDADGSSGFQLTFSLSKDQGMDYGLLRESALEPFSRVILGVIMGAVPEVLADGVITHHELTPGIEPGSSTLTVTGRDLTVMMDLEEKNEKYENQPDSLIVTRILAAYGQYGIVPGPTPTTDIPLLIDRIPRQHETDLQFIQRLAKKNGFVFYIEPVAFGVNFAFWGPETRAGVPQPALSAGSGPDANVKSLSFSNDGLAPVGTEGVFVDPFLKMAIPIPSLPSLRIPPLSGSPSSARRKKLLRSTANQNAGQAATTAVAEVSNTADPVRGEGTLDAVRYGAVLRPRKLVGLCGAGQNYDGNYYVRRVKHSIQRGEYTQQFTLSREGTGTLIPVVLR